MSHRGRKGFLVGGGWEGQNRQTLGGGSIEKNNRMGRKKDQTKRVSPTTTYNETTNPN